MTRLVLSVVGDDRPGLVQALSDVIVGHGGNWEECGLADEAGQFSGFVVVAVPDARARDFTTALGGIEELLRVTPYAVPDDFVRPAMPPAAPGLSLHVLGDDRPGIVHQVADALVELGASISWIKSLTRDAPESGGQLFEADVHVVLPAGADQDEARGALESLAEEIMVDVSVVV